MPLKDGLADGVPILVHHLLSRHIRVVGGAQPTFFAFSKRQSFRTFTNYCFRALNAKLGSTVGMTLVFACFTVSACSHRCPVCFAWSSCFPLMFPVFPLFHHVFLCFQHAAHVSQLASRFHMVYHARNTFFPISLLYPCSHMSLLTHPFPSVFQPRPPSSFLHLPILFLPFPSFFFSSMCFPFSLLPFLFFTCCVQAGGLCNNDSTEHAREK